MYDDIPNEVLDEFEGDPRLQELSQEGYVLPEGPRKVPNGLSLSTGDRLATPQEISARPKIQMRKLKQLSSKSEIGATPKLDLSSIDLSTLQQLPTGIEVNQTPVFSSRLEKDAVALGIKPDQLGKLLNENGESITNGTSTSFFSKFAHPIDALKDFFTSASGIENKTQSSSVFMKLLKNYGIPTVLGIASTFIGIPPTVGFGIGTAVNPFATVGSKVVTGLAGVVASEGGISEIAKTAIKAGADVLGSVLPEVIRVLSDNAVRLVRLIAGAGQSFLSTATSYLISACKSIFNYFTQNRKECLETSDEVIKLARKYTEEAIDEIRLLPKRREVLKETGEIIRELKRSELEWTQVLKRIGKIWEGYRESYANPFFMSKESTDYFRKSFENLEEVVKVPHDEYYNQAMALIDEFQVLAKDYVESYGDSKPLIFLQRFARSATNGRYNPLGAVRNFLFRDPFLILQEEMKERVLDPIRIRINDYFALGAATGANVAARRAQELTSLTGKTTSGNASKRGLFGFGKKPMKRKRGKKYVRYYTR